MSIRLCLSMFLLMVRVQNCNKGAELFGDERYVLPLAFPAADDSMKKRNIIISCLLFNFTRL